VENDIRMIALMTLVDVLENDKYSHIVINEVLKKYQYMSKTNRAFFKRLTEGTIEYKIQLDYIIDCFSNTPSKKMKPIIRNILRMSVYQIKYMDSVPTSAACNEAVKLAKKKGFYNLKGFVNGVLRNIARNIDNIKYPDKEKDKVKYLSVMYSTPEWIIKKWLSDYGSDITKQILKASFSKKKTTICLNTNKTTKDKLIDDLKKESIKYEECEYIKNALRIEDYDYISKLSSFKDGDFFVQDESSMIAVESAGIDTIKGDNILIVDVCAAPGGKTMYASCKLKDRGEIISRDISEYKTSLINDNIKRCDFNNVKVQVQDALILDEELINKADLVIADLPCSGLGVIGQKADIKYKTSKNVLEELVQLQKDILNVVKQYVKPNGVLLYSTCTINIDENEKNVEWFTKENKDFKLESLDDYISKKVQSKTSKKGYLQLFPQNETIDGFFMARFRKIQC